MTARTFRLGFTLIGGGNWKGGLNYQRTLFHLLSSTLAARITPILFVAPADERLARETFEGMTDAIVVDARADGAGQGRRAAAALVAGTDAAFVALTREHAIDVVFENARYFGWRFPLPLLSWMPDFQHRHLPHLFGRKMWWRRELGFRAQTLGPRIALLSSETARRDCERFYPRLRGRTAVARFADRVDISEARARAGGIRATYRLPERYIYVPNQFWSHKNHRIIVDALLRIVASNDAVPSIILSGAIKDPRDPGLFERTMARVESAGLSSRFRHLGLIPYPDVLALNVGADVVLNPSLFEGWASSVEEAKSLGTPMILSAIDVHREQAPGAAFFPPDNADALARLLRETPPRDEKDIVTLQNATEERICAFAAGFTNAIEQACSRYGAA